MIKSVWGLYWRTYVLFLFVSLPMSLIWSFLFLSETGLVLKPSVLHITIGVLLFVPVNHNKGLPSYIFGGRLELDDAVWRNYRKLIGLSYIVYAIILFVISKTLPLSYWVYIKVYGGIFMMYIFPILISSIVILKSENNTEEPRALG
jgi:intracellular septation protein A